MTVSSTCCVLLPRHLAISRVNPGTCHPGREVDRVSTVESSLPLLVPFHLPRQLASPTSPPRPLTCPPLPDLRPTYLAAAGNHGLSG